MARSTVDNSLDPLHIGLPSPVGTSVGVGNLDTKGNALTTKITLRHSSAPPIQNNNHSQRPYRRLDTIPNIGEKCKLFFRFFRIFYFMVDIDRRRGYNGNKAMKMR